MLGTKAQYQNAINKARKLGGSRLIVSQTSTNATVRGTNGTLYYVDRRFYDCTCAAGQRRIPCYHAAAVFVSNASQASARVAR